MEMVPMTRVQHLLDRAAQSLPPAREASLWGFRHGVAQMCAGLLVLLLGPQGVQRVPDCGAPHATVLRSGWMFRIFPHDEGFVLVCTPVQAPDRTPQAFLVLTKVLENPNSAFGAMQHLWTCGITLDTRERWS